MVKWRRISQILSALQSASPKALAGISLKKSVTLFINYIWLFLMGATLCSKQCNAIWQRHDWILARTKPEKIIFNLSSPK